MELADGGDGEKRERERETIDRCKMLNTIAIWQKNRKKKSERIKSKVSVWEKWEQYTFMDFHVYLFGEKFLFFFAIRCHRWLCGTHWYIGIIFGIFLILLQYFMDKSTYSQAIFFFSMRITPQYCLFETFLCMSQRHRERMLFSLLSALFFCRWIFYFLLHNLRSRCHLRQSAVMMCLCVFLLYSSPPSPFLYARAEKKERNFLASWQWTTCTIKLFW